MGYMTMPKHNDTQRENPSQAKTYAELPIEYHRTCRVCKELIDPSNGGEIKYSVRHYAHTRCFITKFGAQIVTMLPKWKLELLPYKRLQDAGLLDLVRKAVEK